MKKLRLMVLLGLLLPAWSVHGMDIAEPLPNPEQQALFDRLIVEVRCLVCQNQTIADSSAPLAADLRREIREMVAQGQSEDEIKTFLTDRYGDFVLYRPRFGGPSLLLWFAPVLFLVIGGVVLWKIIRRRSALPVTEDVDDALLRRD
jgi:cytochrome c-type biogenesis protein CcmH